MTAVRDLWCVVPVKAFDRAKERLYPPHDPDFRQRLARVMLDDVLDAIAGVDGLAGIALVGRDPDLRRIGAARGHLVIDEAGTGLNAAVATAARQLGDLGASGVLILPGDIPGVTPEEIARLLRSHPDGRAVTLVPAHDRRGTNALLASPPDVIPFAYGEDSLARHRASARRAGCTVTIVESAGIALDLDHPENLGAFAETPSSTQTRTFLHDRGIGRSAPRRRSRSEIATEVSS